MLVLRRKRKRGHLVNSPEYPVPLNLYARSTQTRQGKVQPAGNSVSISKGRTTALDALGGLPSVKATSIHRWAKPGNRPQADTRGNEREPEHQGSQIAVHPANAAARARCNRGE